MFKLMDKVKAIDENNEEFKVQTTEGQKKLAYWIVSVLFADQCLFPVAICLHCEKYWTPTF